MRTVNVSIGHDHNLVIPKFIQIDSFTVIIRPYSNAQGLEIILISSLSKTRCSMAFSTFKILPRKGKIA